MGHSKLATTSRYLHARPASERAAAFTTAFKPTAPDRAVAASRTAETAGGRGVDAEVNVAIHRDSREVARELASGACRGDVGPRRLGRVCSG
jgi:hypothetical protein